MLSSGFISAQTLNCYDVKSIVLMSHSPQNTEDTFVKSPKFVTFWFLSGFCLLCFSVSLQVSVILALVFPSYVLSLGLLLV